MALPAAAVYLEEPQVSPIEREQLILSYLPLVKHIALDIARQISGSILLDDLISAGTLGLIEAVDRYDPGYNCPLSAYARIRIRGSIFDYLRQEGWLPRSIYHRSMAGEDDIWLTYLSDLDDDLEYDTPCQASIQQVENIETMVDICNAITQLPAKLQNIIIGHYYQDLSLTEIGRRHRRCQPWASQLHARAIKQLRSMLNADESHPEV